MDSKCGKFFEVMVTSLPEMLLSIELSTDYFVTFSFIFYSPRYFQFSREYHSERMHVLVTRGLMAILMKPP